MTVTVEQAQISLRDLIEKTAQGEKVVIVQDQSPVAELIRVPSAVPVPKFGSCRSMLTIVLDDEDHLKDFEEYMK